MDAFKLTCNQNYWILIKWEIANQLYKLLKDDPAQIKILKRGQGIGYSEELFTTRWEYPETNFSYTIDKDPDGQKLRNLYSRNSYE